MKKIIIGNWKMHKTLADARNCYKIINEACHTYSDRIHIGIACPAVFLSELSKFSSSALLFAQNCHWEEEGAFTGEISTRMLKSIKVSGSLVGHSERRSYFFENNTACGQKVRKLLETGMHAILCVGETLKDRENNAAFSVVHSQIKEALQWTKGLSSPQITGSGHGHLSKLIIAYEPVWAIGTGKVADNKDIAQMHEFIRSILREYLPEKAAASIPLLYGGSVKESNIKDIISLPAVDGALVGGASLNPNEFLKLCDKSYEL